MATKCCNGSAGPTGPRASRPTRPSEARLHPELWGFVRFHDGRRPSTEDRFEADEVAGKPTGKDKAVKADVDDILDSLDEKKK